MGKRSARASATAVLPTPVGPASTGTSGRTGEALPPKAALQLAFRQLHDRWTTVHVVGGQRGPEQPPHQLLCFLRVQMVPRLDGRPAGERRREPLQPFGPPTK